MGVYVFVRESPCTVCTVGIYLCKSECVCVHYVCALVCMFKYMCMHILYVQSCGCAGVCVCLCIGL